MKLLSALLMYRVAMALALFGTLALSVNAQPGPGGPPPPAEAGPGFGPGGGGFGPGFGPGAALMREGIRDRFGPELAMRFGTRLLTTPEAIEKLKLTDDQVSKLKQLEYEANRKRIDGRAEIEQAHLDLRQAMEQDSPDRGKILGLIDQTGKLKTEMHKANATELLAAREILTAEQRKQVKQFMDKRRAAGPGHFIPGMRRFGHAMGKFGGPGGHGGEPFGGPHGGPNNGGGKRGGPPHPEGQAGEGAPGVSFNAPFGDGPQPGGPGFGGPEAPPPPGEFDAAAAGGDLNQLIEQAWMDDSENGKL